MTTPIEQMDINVIVFWIIIVVLALATIGLYVVIQILIVAWKRDKKEEEPIDWPKGRMCLLLRIPNLGTPATGGKLGEPAAGGTMRVEFKITAENGRVWHVHEKVVGYTEGPFMRLYSQSMEGDAESSSTNLT